MSYNHLVKPTCRRHATYLKRQGYPHDENNGCSHSSYGGPFHVGK